MKAQAVFVHLMLAVWLLSACGSQPPVAAETPSPAPTASPLPVTPSPAPSLTPADVFPPAEAIRQMRRGINLGNALEAPREGEWGYRIEREHLRLIRAAGFDSVRIPIRWSARPERTALHHRSRFLRPGG